MPFFGCDNFNPYQIYHLDFCDGTPCFEKTWSTNSWASIGAVMVSTVGINRDCFVSRSTMMRMVSYPEDGGSFSMKSMEMEFQGNSGTGSCLSSP